MIALRPVPEHIDRPPYARGAPDPRPALVKSPEVIERMRRAGRVARAVLDAVLAAVKPGVTTEQLDRLAHDATVARGGYPSPLGYRGFPKSLCTSINEVVCHGIPGNRRLLDGDIVNCDVTVYLDGVHGDCSETVFVGTPSPAARALVEHTWQAMWRGIEAVRDGARVNAIGKAIERYVAPLGYGVVREFGGHGIGECFHMAPNVLHYFERRNRQKLQAGMTLTVEPMINGGDARCALLSDGWTAVTQDGSLSAQFEHTLLVTAEGCEVLTQGDDPRPFFQRAG